MGGLLPPDKRQGFVGNLQKRVKLRRQRPNIQLFSANPECWGHIPLANTAVIWRQRIRWRQLLFDNFTEETSGAKRELPLSKCKEHKMVVQEQELQKTYELDEDEWHIADLLSDEEWVGDGSMICSHQSWFPAFSFRRNHSFFALFQPVFQFHTFLQHTSLVMKKSLPKLGKSESGQIVFGKIEYWYWCISEIIQKINGKAQTTNFGEDEDDDGDDLVSAQLSVPPWPLLRLPSYLFLHPSQLGKLLLIFIILMIMTMTMMMATSTKWIFPSLSFCQLGYEQLIILAAVFEFRLVFCCQTMRHLGGGADRRAEGKLQASDANWRPKYFDRTNHLQKHICVFEIHW